MGDHKANFFEKILYKLHLKKPNYILSQDDRNLAMSIRQKRAQLKLKELQVQEAQLDKAILNIAQETPEEKLSKVFSIVLGNMMGGFAGSSGSQGSASPQKNLKQYEDVPDEEIKKMLVGLDPKMLNYLKSLDDNSLRSMAQTELGISGQNVERAISILREV